MYYCDVNVGGEAQGDLVASHKTQPPWEFLLFASKNSLQSYEFSRLGHAANLKKEIAALLDQWLEENACAMLARWLMEHRELPSTALETVMGLESRTPQAASVSDNFLPEPTSVRPAARDVI